MHKALATAALLVASVAGVLGVAAAAAFVESEHHTEPVVQPFSE
ncbi:hypothetical protein [Streptomyces sp. NPDC088785]